MLWITFNIRCCCEKEDAPVGINANAPKQVVYKNEWAPILYKYEASVSGKGMSGVRLTDIDCVDREDISKD